jgi:hypothetical protein
LKQINFWVIRFGYNDESIGDGWVILGLWSQKC